MANGEKENAERIGDDWRSGQQQQEVAAARTAGRSSCVDGIGLIQGDREATEHRNDWHGGKRAAFGKRRQRGLWEGRAATGGKGLGQGELNAERYDGWHSGKRAAAGKCKHRGLREGGAAVDGKRRERERRDHWG